jgi:serine/threonine protein phosphatase PrpC
LASPKAAFSAMCLHIALKSHLQICTKIIDLNYFFIRDSLMYQLESFGLSHIGLARSNNEDVFETIPEKQFFILADGMGGHKAGEIAAGEAVRYICDVVRKADLSLLKPEALSHFLRKTLEAASSHVWQLSRKSSDYAGMGTTLSCFLIREGRLFYAHVGDSRLYRFRPSNVGQEISHVLHQLTLDHSLKACSLADELVGACEVGQVVFKNVITRALGTSPYVIADVGVISLLPGDIYFLCSDGLTDVVPDHKMSEILSLGAQVPSTVDALIHTALEKGGNDNITILMARLTPTRNLPH